MVAYGTQLLLTLQATTGPAGVALQNGTPNILQWTAPNDGQLHRVLALSSIDVTVATTGGQVWLNGTMPDGTGCSAEVDIGSHASTGYSGPVFKQFLVKPGTTVSLQQTTAVTVGAATCWAELWAA
jgi:hypothetical protein